jgi:tetratricopeptide (TPR) repeat protein
MSSHTHNRDAQETSVSEPLPPTVPDPDLGATRPTPVDGTAGPMFGALFKESLAMNRQLFGEAHPEVTANLSNLGLLARDRGDYRQADILFAQVVAADKRVLGPAHIQVGRALNNWAESVRRSGDPRRAESLLRESIAIHAAALSPTHWQTASTRSLLAQCLIAEQRFAEAERLLLEAYATISREFGVAHARTKTVAERTVELYDAWKRPTEAGEWRTKLQLATPAVR